jgi:hypothetical protein
VTPAAIAFVALALAVLWGGLFLTTVYLTLRPEPAEWPPGAEDDLEEDELPLDAD